MSRLILFVFLLAFVANAQVPFEKDGFFGLKYDGAEYCAPVFDEVVVKGFFAYGRQGSTYFNLSKNKDFIDKPYSKFKFHLIHKLLVVGITQEGKVDLMDETGQNYFMTDGDYSKLIDQPNRITYQNDDILITKKGRKKGLYLWPEKREIIPPKFDKISIHEACGEQKFFIYGKQKGLNQIIDELGNVVMSFKSFLVDDMHPATICEGYMIRTKGYIGYCCKLRSGKYFLIKPRFDEFIFPWDDSKLIITKRADQYGLYYNYQRLLKPKYDQIEVLDDPYLLARIERNEVSYILKKSGKIVVD